MLYNEDMQWYRPHVNRRGASDFEAPDKGVFKGSCNRSCCQAPHMATWWNQGSHSYYCFACARILNKANNFPNELARLPLDTTQLCIPVSHPKHPNHGQVTDLVAQKDFDDWTVRYTNRAVALFNGYLCDPKLFIEILTGEMVLEHFRSRGLVCPSAITLENRPFSKPLDPEARARLPYSVTDWVKTFYISLNCQGITAYLKQQSR